MKILTALLLLMLITSYAYSQGVGMRISDSGVVKVFGRPSPNYGNSQITETFHIDQDGSFFAKGELGVGHIPYEGPGYRTMWHSYKGSFRSGYAYHEWDDSLTGFFSWAGGSNTLASGLYSLSFGDANIASSTSSIAFGSGNKVYGAAGFSAGAGNQVDDTYGVAFGNQSKSRSLASVAMGYNLIAKGFAGTVVGMWNDSLMTATEENYTSTTPLFVVGNGSGTSARSNAMVVRKNGDVEVDNLKVGGGNVVSKQVSGTFTVGSSTAGSKVMSFTFPTYFTAPPRIVVTPRSEAGSNYPDAFIVTVRSISGSTVTFNIFRIDATVGWSQSLQLDYIAWQ